MNSESEYTNNYSVKQIAIHGLETRKKRIFIFDCTNEVTVYRNAKNVKLFVYNAH